MEKKSTKKKLKKRASEYEPKLHFEGTFGDLVKMSIKDAEKKQVKEQSKKA